MFRTTDIVLIALMVAAAAFTYVTKHDAESQLRTVRELQAEIRFENETIDVLKADWSLLTQPSRLQRLADTYHDELRIVPLQPHQFAEIDDLPMPPLKIEDLSTDPLGGIAGIIAEQGAVDSTTTGGIAPATGGVVQ